MPQRKMKIGTSAANLKSNFENPNGTPIPDPVSILLYGHTGNMIWSRDDRHAFENSKYHDLGQIREALTWLVLKFGGHITWAGE